MSTDKTVDATAVGSPTSKSVTLNPVITRGVSSATASGPGIKLFTGASSAGATLITMLSLNVAPADDAPVNNFIPGPLAVAEDTPLVMTGFSVTDFDVGDPTAVASTVLSVDMGGSLTVVPAGTATIAGNGTNSVTITGTAAEINLVLAGNVTYQGALNFNGTETVNMLTTDTGGVNSDSDNIVINVAPADDAPVNNFIPGPLAVAEDTPLVMTGFSVTDFDVGDPTAVASTVLSVDMGGSLTVVPAGTATIAGNGTNSVTITGTAAEINLVLAGNVTYQGALNFNGTETVNMLTTDTGGVNSDSDNIVINVAPVFNAPSSERRFLEPESFLNTDSVNETIYNWQVTNDPTSPVLTTINNIRNENIVNSVGVFETDNVTNAELSATSSGESDSPTYVQNSVRHLDLEASSASIQQTVKASQLESTGRGIRIESVDNTAIPAVVNIIDPFAPSNLSKNEKDLNENDTQGKVVKKPVATEKQIDESLTKKSYTVDPEPISHLNQEVEKEDLKDNQAKKKASDSFTDQLHSMATKMHLPSSNVSRD